MTRQDALAEGILACKALTARYLAGFNEVNRVRQTPDLPNHLAWCLGHCALTMNRAAALIDVQPLPPSDFLTGDGTRGTPDKFDTESVCFGSRPEDRHDHFPTLARCAQVYDGACDRLAAAVQHADDAALDKSVRWGSGEFLMYQLVLRMIFHNGMHVGQIADMRRALAMRSISG